ncbi:nuclear transport factor 2 family protein [Nocardia sp. NPDC004711]
MNATAPADALPEVVAAHIAAVNGFDLDAIVATFAEDALVNDVRREFAGTASIRAWARHELVGDKVTMEVTEVVPHPGLTIVRARYDGQYDKTNVPDELILTSYFTTADGKITSLIIVHNQPAPY